MSDDFDRREWQARQEAQDAALEKQRVKDEKAKARAARNAQRKLERLRKTLMDKGELTEWEDEFSESVSERLDKFGSAFADPEKGRRSDALSFAQKKVVSALNKKAKGEMKKSGFKSKGGFKSKSKGFTPRVRHIEEDMPPEPEISETKPAEPYIPEYTPERPNTPKTPKRPFLRIVKNEDEE